MAKTGEEAQVILKETPFYAESGGQVADKGVLRARGLLVRVTDVKKAPNGQHLHTVVVEEGELSLGQPIEAIVEETERNSIVKNHTATHLLHQQGCLRKVQAK